MKLSFSSTYIQFLDDTFIIEIKQKPDIMEMVMDELCGLDYYFYIKVINVWELLIHAFFI